MADENEVVDRGDNFAPTGLDADKAAAAATTSEPTPEVTAAAEAPATETTAQAEEVDDRGKDDKGRFIPKDRFDEAVRKERAEKEVLANRLKEFEARDAQNRVTADFAEAQKAVKEMIKQHTSLLADGELEKAANLMEQILDLKEAVAERKAEFKADSAKNAAKEEVRYDATVARLEADFPVINPDHADYDPAVVRRVQAYMSGLMQTERMPAAQALKEACDTLLEQPKKADAEDVGMRRKEAAVQKAMDAKAKQPPSTKDVGLDHDKTGGALDASAVMKMTWDEFVKLPDSKLAEMRGDFVS